MRSSNHSPWLFFVENLTVIVYIGLIFGALFLMDLQISISITLGGALGYFNFALLVRIGEKVFRTPQRPKMSYFLFAWVKFGVVLTVLFFAIQSGWFNPLALLIGFSDFVIAIFLGSAAWWIRYRSSGAEKQGQGA